MGTAQLLTTQTKAGSTIRLTASRAPTSTRFFHCQTDLVDTFRSLYPTGMTYCGNRAIIFDIGDDIPEPALRHCLGLALTYHSRKRPMGGTARKA